MKKGEELGDVLTRSGIIASNSEFRRLIKEKAIEVNGAVLNDIHFIVAKTFIVKVGKRRFLKIIV